MIPTSTYRVQFHKNFSFRNANETNLFHYLQQLGISDLYSSPILKGKYIQCNLILNIHCLARPGSTHGYDVVFHHTINPECGEEKEFLQLSDTLKSNGMGLIVDIVPNHMGVNNPGNVWWMDVLEHGKFSKYAEYFDIDWNKSSAKVRLGKITLIIQGKLLVPILGSHLGQVIEHGELKLQFENGKFFLTYYDHKLPLAPESYSIIMEIPGTTFTPTI